MIITCTSCSARYQLADSKIKATGTKVRCPKCSTKFLVYPEGMDQNAERTELLGRASSPRIETSASTKAAASTRMQERPQFSETREPGFDVPTRAKAESAKTQTSSKKAPVQVEDEMTPVFERNIPDPTPVKQKASAPPPQEEEPSDLLPRSDARQHSSPEDSGPESDQTPSQVKPFGAETLFEIQRTDRKRKFPKWLGASLIAILVLGGTYLALPSLQKLLPTGGSSSAKIQIERPSGWYRDDPGVYQEEMVRQAGLPMAEKELPENVALLAEALVLNGLIAGAQDQVNQGLLFAQKLQLEHPNTAAPLYALSANAIAADQLMVMDTVLKRWPEANRADPEYRLLEFMTLIKVGQIEEGITKAKELLTEFPEFQRANDYALLSVLQNGPQAANVIDRKFREQITNRYDSQRNLRERSMSLLPPLYLEIDRLMGRKPKMPEPTPTPKAEPKITEPVKTEELKPIPRSVETVAIAPGEDKPGPQVQKPSVNKPAAKKNSKRLPPPSDDLVENTKLDTQEKRDARKFFTQGNDLYKKGDVDGALAAYRQALKLDPEFSDVYKRLGILYMEQKRNDRAVRSFKIYLQLRPNATDKKEVERWISQLQ